MDVRRCQSELAMISPERRALALRTMSQRKAKKQRKQNLNSIFRSSFNLPFDTAQKLFLLAKRNEFQFVEETIILVSARECPKDLCNSIIGCFKPKDLEDFTKKLLKTSLSADGVTSKTVLRMDSPATHLISAWMRSKANNLGFLTNACTPLIKRILAKKSKLEINPCKVNEATCLKNLEIVRKWLASFICNLPKISNYLPNEIRTLFKLIQESVVPLFPSCDTLVIGSFLFLRYLCPALISPNNYGLLGSYSPKQMQTAVLLSKVIQNIVTGVPFDGSKEEYMKPLNEQIDLYHNQIKTWIVSLVGEQAPETPRTRRRRASSLSSPKNPQVKRGLSLSSNLVNTSKNTPHTSSCYRKVCNYYYDFVGIIYSQLDDKEQQEELRNLIPEVASLPPQQSSKNTTKLDLMEAIERRKSFDISDETDSSSDEMFSIKPKTM